MSDYVYRVYRTHAERRWRLYQRVIYAVLALLLLLAATPAFLRWWYRSWDTCEWLRLEATAVSSQEAALPEDELPSTHPRSDRQFAHWVQLVEPYYSEGRCLEGWARLQLGRVLPVVR